MPKPTDQAARELMIHELATLSGRGVEEGVETFAAYFATTARDVDDTLERIRTSLRPFADGESVGLRHRWQEHTDWADVWRRGLTPRRITRTLVVSPTWMRPRLLTGDVLISIDPGIAFGTAEHATTRGCLRLLEGLVRDGDRVADVGAGSGILSVAAALFGARHVVAVDSDPWACAATRRNAVVNGVEDRIEVVEIAVSREFLSGHTSFDGLVSNIEAQALIPLLRGFACGVREGGWLILSGIQASEAEGVVGAAATAGFALTRHDIELDWWSGAFSRFSESEAPSTSSASR